jgi:tRNA threonylcarbamoyladenosine modification (KEOPS) complex  Pcc1 subunit
MKYESTFKLKKDSKLKKALTPDISKTDRAEWNIKEDKEYLKITVKAKDIVALKAFNNSIIKLLDIHNKINKF